MTQMMLVLIKILSLKIGIKGGCAVWHKECKKERSIKNINAKTCRICDLVVNICGRSVVNEWLTLTK